VIHVSCQGKMRIAAELDDRHEVVMITDKNTSVDLHINCTPHEEQAFRSLVGRKGNVVINMNSRVSISMDARNIVSVSL
jgi:predicted PilT family ATPase